MAGRTLLCISSYVKGFDFLHEARRLGCHVVFLTTTALQDADWPRESIDEFFAMPDLAAWDDVCNAVSYLARTRVFDRIVALDEYDVPLAAALREHLRIPGMGASQARLFRDKLAMRFAAHDADILVPDFVPAFNYEAIREYTQRVPPPWLLKPRAEATAIGIARVDSVEDLGSRLETLGDRQSHFLIECYVPGSVHHVDSIVKNGAILFAEAHEYARPPMDVFHGGGIAMSRTVARGSDDEAVLREMNGRVIEALGMREGVTHMEFIRAREDGRLYFLEVAARVGGANTSEMVEAATGINLWREWARLEVLGDQYELPQPARRHAGVIVSLARHEYPDTSQFTDPEVVYRIVKRHHIGFVLAADSAARIVELQDAYSQRIVSDYAASMPAWESRPATE